MDNNNNIQNIESNVNEEIKVAAKKRGRPAKVEKDIFIQMWNNASSLNDVAASVGMPSTSVSVKASLLRKSGHQLKKFRRGRRAKVK